ncbi:MAG: SusD/RagB family nutrient-binding outer membrane lipoprotein [Saprospiraceae bacterium]|nr:SusD/RagB family nutrient-binding outer membrane lipoprotein [Saprospiraceae bacterium]
MKYTLKIFSMLFLFFVSSCSLTNLEENLDNPNEVPVDQLDLTALYNKVQLDFSEFVSLSNTPTLELSRMMALTGGDTYARAYQAQDFDNIWGRAYQDVLNQISAVLAETDGTSFTVHSGSARVMRAYVLMTLVDLFGNVPYSEALQGATGNFNPKADNGKAVYEAALKDLNDAIALLGTAQAGTYAVRRDVFYGGSNTAWRTLAKTLKLKIYNNLRLTDASAATAINDLLTENDLIDSDGEEFTYRYSSADVPARSRHPQYRDMYKPALGDGETYINNYFMYVLYKQKGLQDPRWRYYFYRQVDSLTTALADEPESVPCVFTPPPAHYAGLPFCAFEPGFFGRDHGNNDGVPPDAPYKTAVGVYPCGGRADVNENEDDYISPTQQGQGANGEGIQPIWMANFTTFMKAEIALKVNNDAATARSLMIQGVNESINRVRKFAALKNQNLPAGLEPSQSAYVAEVGDLYDQAATDFDRLNVISKEFYISLWGNGIEAYNLYRRTGCPSDLQPMRTEPANAGVFLRSLLYPSDFVNLNSSVSQKPNNVANKVFWDNNPDNLFR